jgi:hypothetical protein
MGLMSETYVTREYTLTLRLPLTLRVPADGLERHLKEDSEPFRRLLAQNMIEDWDVIFGGYDDAAEEQVAVKELARWIAGAELKGEEYEEEI